MDENTVTYYVKDYREAGKWKALTIPGVEFIRRFLIACAAKTFCPNQALRFTVYPKQDQASYTMQKSSWLQTISVSIEKYGNSTNTGNTLRDQGFCL